MHITIHSKITDESINIKIELGVLVHNKQQVFDINRITSNLNGIPAVETELVTV